MRLDFFLSQYLLDVCALISPVPTPLCHLIPGFKLQSQCILLPEQEAKSHGIFHCQAVCVCASKESSQSQGSSAVPLKEVVLPLEGEEVEKRMHVALAYLYKDTAALERYVPTSSLGSRHEGASLQLAYIHPELLFFLYPETIAASRRLQLSIKVSGILI